MTDLLLRDNDCDTLMREGLAQEDGARPAGFHSDTACHPRGATSAVSHPLAQSSNTTYFPYLSRTIISREPAYSLALNKRLPSC
jgi:hypothetical protein